MNEKELRSYTAETLLKILRLIDAATDANNGVKPLSPMDVWDVCSDILSGAPTKELNQARAAWRIELEKEVQP